MKNIEMKKMIINNKRNLINMNNKTLGGINIISFFKKILSNWKNFIILILLVFSGVLYINYRLVRHNYENIIIETSDTLSVYKNKMDELYSERSVFITDIKNLKKTNSDLYNEVKNLKDHPLVVSEITTVTDYHDIIVKDTIYLIDSTEYKSDIEYSDKWCEIKGSSVFNISKLTSIATFESILTHNTLTVDIIEKDDNISIVAKSDNPYTKINNIEGAILSPEKIKTLRKRFDQRWCVVAGVGVSGVVYDGNTQLVPGINITLGYKLFGF